jgi:hypothetical protein
MAAQAVQDEADQAESSNIMHTLVAPLLYKAA